MLLGGGTGYGLDNRLPDEIEHIMPDYSLYGITDTAYGFLTRGCPRHCPFCIVGDKEGLVSRKVADLSEFWNGQKNIKLLDPNLIACKEWGKLLSQLIDSKAHVDFTQGVDIRLMTKEKAEMLKLVKMNMIHFAWDNYPDETTYEKLKLFSEYVAIDYRKTKVYVLTNFKTTHKQDLERVYRLKDLGYDPYVMVYDKPHAPLITRQLQRYVNNKTVFRSCKSFDEYLKNRGSRI